MTTEKMTIHKALCELKVADARIEKLIHEDFCAAAMVCSKKVAGIDKEEFCRNSGSVIGKICDIYNRAEAIKAAVCKSNAATEIIVRGELVTIAEAIWMKDHGIKRREKILNALSNQYDIAMRIAAEENGEALDKKVERYIRASYGDSSGDKATSKEIAEAEAKYRETHMYEVVNGLPVFRMITKMSEEIDAFKAEIDSAIQVSNAITTIEITY